MIRNLLNQIWILLIPLLSLFSTYKLHFNVLQHKQVHHHEAIDLFQMSKAIEEIHPLDYFTCANEQNIQVKLPKWPSFIIIGTHKGGTTALFAVLKNHPNIVSSRRHETHFFDTRGNLHPEHIPKLRSDPKFLCSIQQQYISMFPSPNRTNSTIAFEKTPLYMTLSHLPEMISLIAPWAKILVSLRDPVDRYQSGFGSNGGPIEPSIESDVLHMHSLQLTRAPLFSNYINHTQPYTEKDFDIPPGLTQNQRNMVQFSPNRGLYRGLYAQQLKNWLPYFPLGSKMHILDFTDLQTDFAGTMNKLLPFVGAAAFDFSSVANLDKDYSPDRWTKRNVTMQTLTIQYMKKFYRPYNQELYELLGENWKGRWDWA